MIADQRIILTLKEDFIEITVHELFISVNYENKVKLSGRV